MAPLRALTRPLAQRTLASIVRSSRIAQPFSTGLTRRYPEDHNKGIDPKTAGSLARTSPDVTVSYPPDHTLRPARPVTLSPEGEKPTMSIFSLDGKVGVVTGGARGLGLVMAQGMCLSGMNVALVDLNSAFFSNKSFHLLFPPPFLYFLSLLA